ncbi:MAG: type II toxin-antitoxin system HicA family toxin [bacterium]|nr:type II toxin-antitoxin system HicA family toxin [bacterium]
MKRRELEKLLHQLGWRLLRHGAKHDIWTNGDQEEAIPRHSEINEMLARMIVKNARKRD